MIKNLVMISGQTIKKPGMYKHIGHIKKTDCGYISDQCYFNQGIFPTKCGHPIKWLLVW